ncbi:hypothetical protein IQ260_00555 [Leptolyngbya cf. ectocarpi LEGE 11479]|uniref:Uncharacterized protein n=1 Tax=Leptolyngbya cf. ectocarpi LEGE 11479 TaxID=1828722 RepID=A0A928ZQ94_LEPEC|nr:hypothetical protein [Leptolyngbya ectocarpi]MBE9065143.1 hypothetical protein [Leptolyngbya cf. ectocarpi LEGE 11479]
MSKPITYYVQTPAVDRLCNKYGSYWQGLTNKERLNIASAVAQHLLYLETDSLNLLLADASLCSLATRDEFEFEDHDEVMRLLDHMEIQLDATQMVRLLEGIYSNMTF